MNDEYLAYRFFFWKRLLNDKEKIPGSIEHYCQVYTFLIVL